jgi:hypothetical protein
MAVKQYIPAVKYGNLVASDEIDAGAITGAKLSTGTGYFTVAANTNGTTAVSVFGASGLPVAVTITGVFLIAQDTTTGNITVENPASTVVCTIAKGATAGACVGATTLSNTTVAAGTNLVVDSSSAGNARVFITFTVA